MRSAELHSAAVALLVRFPASFRRRRAFTLLEMMLVLALLVVIVTISWPALDRPFAFQRLRKTGDLLRADLTRARVAAMDSGNVQVLMFDTAANRYVAQTLDDAPVRTAFMFHALPEGIVVSSLEAIDDVTSPPLNPATASLRATAGSTVYFHPDGTTSTAVFVLSNEQGGAVRVDLRGLTGATSVGDVVSVEAGR